MKTATPIQRKILTLLYWQEALDRTTTVREVMEYFGFTSSNSMHEHLLRLRKKGFVTWSPHKSRTLRLTPAGRATADRVVHVDPAVIAGLADLGDME